MGEIFITGCEEHYKRQAAIDNAQFFTFTYSLSIH